MIDLKRFTYYQVATLSSWALSAGLALSLFLRGGYRNELYSYIFLEVMSLQVVLQFAFKRTMMARGGGIEATSGNLFFRLLYLFLFLFLLAVSTSKIIGALKDVS